MLLELVLRPYFIEISTKLVGSLQICFSTSIIFYSLLQSVIQSCLRANRDRPLYILPRLLIKQKAAFALKIFISIYCLKVSLESRNTPSYLTRSLEGISISPSFSPSSIVMRLLQKCISSVLLISKLIAASLALDII